MASQTSKKPKPVCVVDTNEAAVNRSICRELEKVGFLAVKENHPVGDYMLYGEKKNLIIERKSADDFIKSIADRRLIDQCLGLVNVENAEPRILLEGSLGEVLSKKNPRGRRYRRRWKPQSIYGMIISVVESWGIPIHIVNHRRDVPMYLWMLQQNISRQKKPQMYPLRMGKAPRSLDARARRIVEGFPKVGPVLADGLLKEFGSLKGVILNADDATKVRLLGPKKRGDMVKIINHKYRGIGKK